MCKDWKKGSRMRDKANYKDEEDAEKAGVDIEEYIETQQECGECERQEG